MMNYNIDFITHNLSKKRPPHSSRTFQTHTKALVQSIDRILKKDKNKARQAFTRLTAASKRKVDQFSVIQRMIDHRIQSVFYDLLHFACGSRKGGRGQQKRYDYPSAIISKVISQNNLKYQEEAFKILKKNNRQHQFRQNHLTNMFDIFIKYAKRNVARKFFRGMVSSSIKASEYYDHMRGFEYLFETIRVKTLFEAFACLSIKTINKNAGELEKQRTNKRQQARLSFMKRSEVLNELKRKVTNAIGQVNEAQINNNRKRVNGSRENGMKLTRVNEQMRVLELNTQDLELKVTNLSQQLNRKQQYLSNRSNNSVSIDFLKELYSFIGSVDCSPTNSDSIFKKITNGVNFEEKRQTLNFEIMDNIILKQEMNIYEKIGQPKKTESFLNVQNQNDSLKMLISSLMKTQFLTESVTAMSLIAHELKQEVADFRQERSAIQQETK